MQTGGGGRQAIMDLQELIAELKKLGKEDAAKLIKELEEDSGTNERIFQPIYRRGHSAKTEEVKVELKQKDDKITALESQVGERSTRIAELEKEKPDVEKLTREKEEALKAKDSEWQKKVDDLTEKLTGERGSTDEAALKSALLALSLDPDWVETQVYKLLHVDKRLKRDADGNRKVYQKDGQTPIEKAGDKTPLQILAGEIHGSAPDWAKKSKVQEGGPGSPGDPLGGGDFDSIRKAEAALVEARSKGGGQQSAAATLGMTGST